MSNTTHLILHPMIVEQNHLLTVQKTDGSFKQQGYVIKTKTGHILRKGCITNSMNPLQLRMVGMKSGSYFFVMGDEQEEFQVI